MRTVLTALLMPLCFQILTTEYNIGFQQPSKDRCRLCVEWECADQAGELTDAARNAWKLHTDEVDEMRSQLKGDIELDLEVPDIVCACFDLQQVGFVFYHRQE